MKLHMSPVVNVVPIGTAAFGVMHEESNQNALPLLKS